MNHEESKLQAQIFMALNRMGIFAFYVPNDAAGRTSAARGARLKAMGLRAGVSDLVVIMPNGVAVFIEIKTATGRLSESQKKFSELCSQKSWDYCVVRSVDEAVNFSKKMIDKHGAKK